VTRAALRALLREAALAYGPFGQYDRTLGNRPWTAYDAMATADLDPPNGSETPKGSGNPEARDDRRDHDRHSPRVL